MVDGKKTRLRNTVSSDSIRNAERIEERMEEGEKGEKGEEKEEEEEEDDGMAAAADHNDFCEQCHSVLAFSEEGFPTCTNGQCGRMYTDIMFQGAEWRYYGADDHQQSDPTRCGMPINPLLEESSYGCKVLGNGAMSYEMRKIRRYAEWQSMPYREKSRFEDFQLITVMANNAGIPKLIVDDANRMHKRISESEVSYRGENRDAILAASIYLSCRMNGYPRTAREIANIFHLEITSATKGCKNALAILNDLEKNLHVADRTAFGSTTPAAFIERYCSKLHINHELTKLCQFIAVKIEQLHIMPENTPPSIASGVVYFVAQLCRLAINKRDVRAVSDISEVTINKCFKKLEKILQEHPLLPPSILRKYGVALSTKLPSPLPR